MVKFCFPASMRTRLLTSMAADCRVSQVVDVRKGVHCMMPKSIFTKRS